MKSTFDLIQFNNKPNQFVNEKKCEIYPNNLSFNSFFCQKSLVDNVMVLPDYRLKSIEKSKFTFSFKSKKMNNNFEKMEIGMIDKGKSIISSWGIKKKRFICYFIKNITLRSHS
jgi:hypothetical protein